MQDNKRIPPLRRCFAKVMFVAIFIPFFWGCTAKQIDVHEVKKANPFDYEETDISSILEFANRFALQDEATQSRICTELQQQATGKPAISSGIALHLAATQLFIPSCGDLPQVQTRLVALSQDESAPSDQRYFAMMALRLVAQHNEKTTRKPTKRVKSRKSAATGTKAVSGERAENRPEENVSPSSTSAPPTDAIARKKLEALRNLEKAMDRAPTP